MSGLTNQLVTIGEMTELIGLATNSETLDAYGATVPDIDTPDTNIRAKVVYERTDEAERGTKQEKFLTEIKCFIRYNSNVSEYKYVYWREKWYDIYAVEFIQGRTRFHVIKARLHEA